MNKKISILIVLSILISSSTFVSATTFDNKKFPSNNKSDDWQYCSFNSIDMSDNKLESDSIYYKNAILTEEEIKILYNQLEEIEDLSKRKIIENMLDSLIEPNGRINIDSFKSLMTTINDKFSKQSNYKKSISNLKTSSDPPSTATVFTYPYTKTGGYVNAVNIDDYACRSGNSGSGAIGTYAQSDGTLLYGEATAYQSMWQKFYVGRTKELSFDAKIIRSGETIVTHIEAFPETRKIYQLDPTGCYYITLESPWDWNIIISKIIGLVLTLLGSQYQIVTIIDAILNMKNIYNGYELRQEFNELKEEGDAETIHVEFQETFNKGEHEIGVGLGCHTWSVLGMASLGFAVNTGQVLEIVIDGIAAPNTPTISGTSSGIKDQSYEFTAKSTDPNTDDIKYKINWGDGTNTGWSGFVDSGTQFKKSHTYNEEGTYTIKVIVEDIDKMQSEKTHTITIRKNQAPSVPSVRCEQVGIGEYRYYATSTDPDGHDVKYNFESDSGETKSTNYVSSGTSAYVTYSSLKPPRVRAKATDELGESSRWSDYKARFRSISIINFLRNINFISLLFELFNN